MLFCLFSEEILSLKQKVYGKKKLTKSTMHITTDQNGANYFFPHTLYHYIFTNNMSIALLFISNAVQYKEVFY